MRKNCPIKFEANFTGKLEYLRKYCMQKKINYAYLSDL
ncbi:MAG: hypothetical protein RIR11_880 [Bacteroidota bacterium]|jgi:hypothetical protein